MSFLKRYIELDNKWDSLKLHGKENTVEEEYKAFLLESKEE